MARGATINISLTPQQLRLVRQRVDSGQYESASELIRESLRMLFQQNRLAAAPSVKRLERRLAAGYKASAARDRKLARELN
jgi:antitoxin ParD1/3/4